ncbi:penicillin-binding protein 2 [Wenyingzhuangia sp. IMCC45574]
MKKSQLFPFLVIITSVIFIARLYYLQVIVHDKTETKLTGSSIKKVYTYPARGFVFDRKGKLLVANENTYDVKIVPNEVKPFDTLEFCRLLKIDKDYLIKKYNRAYTYSPWLPSVFLSQLAKEDYAFLQEKIHKFKGFSVQKKNMRTYPHQSAANVLGYINEVNEERARKSSYYEQGELIGTTGIEKQYEKELRGKKGVAYKQRNRLNKILGPYKEGIYDTLPEPGKDLKLTLDLELQQYGELLMKGKRGGIVAIEPETGEILALITAPSYDPNMMVGRQKSKNSVKLFNDTINLPMFDRGLMASYAPGSPFKLVQGLVGMQEGVINEYTRFYCYGGYRYGRRAHEFMGCHCGIYGHPIQLQRAIAKSCNSYFSNVFKRIVDEKKTPQEGVDSWARHLRSFGLGQFLGYDLPTGRKGRIPTASYYDKYYPTHSWQASTIISNAIGQGEVETTPIQLANLTAAIANRGYFYTPHIIKEIGGEPHQIEQYRKVKKTTVEPKYFPPVIEGMHDVYKKGTAKHVRLKEIEICGKTGTVQNYIISKGKKTALPDHSIFVAFAPKENPKIAMAIFVENGGYGSTIAAPIASLMIEKYLLGTKTLGWWEKRILNKSLEKEYQKYAKLKAKK